MMFNLKADKTGNPIGENGKANQEARNTGKGLPGIQGKATKVKGELG